MAVVEIVYFTWSVNALLILFIAFMSRVYCSEYVVIKRISNLWRDLYSNWMFSKRILKRDCKQKLKNVNWSKQNADNSLHKTYVESAPRSTRFLCSASKTQTLSEDLKAHHEAWNNIAKIILERWLGWWILGLKTLKRKIKSFEKLCWNLSPDNLKSALQGQIDSSILRIPQYRNVC